ncbi:tetratricopeptide repeat protein [Spirosoma sp. BT702]|uniref:Tetratricopeptide repeat protein n=1 Tax=Spirosoma profusum TaxID=2771354 RepID=A0A926XW03_9BACT|nr:histidine kinase [Spirosoma profusum]MBD2700801.1 tetratricopeptide repeat protein [Spirosoma profusum]
MKHYRRYVLSLILSQLLVVVARAQPTATSVSDSLLRYLQTAKQDTSYVRVANEYANRLINFVDDLAKADSVLRSTERLAKRLNDPMGLQRVYFNRGRYWMRSDEGNLAPSIQAFEKARQLVLDAHLPPGELQRNLSGLGQAYFFNNQFEVSLRYYLDAIQLTERYKLNEYVTLAYSGAGEVLRTMGREQEAKKYAQKAYEVAQTDRDRSMRLRAELTIAYYYKGRSDSQQALVHFRKALTYVDQYANRTIKVSLWGDLSNFYRATKQYDSAFHYLEIARLYCLRNEVSLGAKLWINTCLGNYYQDTRNYVRAEASFRKAWQIANQYNWALEKKEASESLANLYAQTNQFQKAYRFQVLLSQLNDSLFSNQSAQKIRDLETRHQIEKRETQIKLLNQQTQNAQFQRNAWIIGAALLLFLGITISAWLLNRARLRRLQEAQALRQQIAHDLHDEVGSTLSSISLLSGMAKGLIAQNRPERIEQAIHKINTDARQILESVDEIIWTINPGNDTLHRIALRLQEYAQPLMESKDIDFDFTVDATLDGFPVPMEVRRNLYLIGKEAINNLVKYSHAMKATLRFEQQNGQLKVLIEDDGQGFDVAQPTTRTGQTSMQQRATDMGGTLAIQSTPGLGTRLQLVVGL